MGETGWTPGSESPTPASGQPPVPDDEPSGEPPSPAGDQPAPHDEPPLPAGPPPPPQDQPIPGDRPTPSPGAGAPQPPPPPPPGPWPPTPAPPTPAPPALVPEPTEPPDRPGLAEHRPSQPRSRPVAALAVMALAAAALVVPAAIVLADDDDRRSSGDEDPSDDGALGSLPDITNPDVTGTDPSSTPTTGPSSGSSTTAPAATGDTAPVDPDAFTSVEGPGGEFTIAIPDGWVTAPMTGDRQDVVEQTFPEGGRRAELLDLILDNWSSPQSRLLVLDAEGLDGEPVPEMLVIAADEVPQTDLDTAFGVYRTTRERQGADIVEEGRIDTAAGEAAWVEIAPSPTGSLPEDLHTIEFVVVVGGRSLWTFTYRSDELPDDRAMVEHMVGSFTTG